MGQGILMDKILKLIIEDVHVTRAEQISNQLNVDNGTVIHLLEEMEKSGHLQLVKSGSRHIYVIIVKSLGRQFYKSSSYSELYNETVENKSSQDKVKYNRKMLAWIIIAILAAILLVVGFKQNWFS